MFPSPSDDDIDTTSTRQTHQSSIDEAMDNLLSGFAKRGHPGRYQSTTGYIPPSERVYGKHSRYHDSSNSLAYSLAFSAEGSKEDTQGANLKREDSSLSGRGMSPAPERDTVNTSPPPLPKTWLLPLPSDSSVKCQNKGGCVEVRLPVPMERSSQASSTAQSMPTISKHDKILREMMDANARARAARADTGSLSDSCEDDEFILTCPSTTASEMADGSRPPKQRRRDSYESGLSSSYFNDRRESCTSLASGLASASSLFGMEFYQEEGLSVASPVYISTTPFSSISYKSKNSGSHDAFSPHTGDDGFAPLGLHHRFRKSEHSFGSIGLSLDGPSSAVDEHQGRDLVTPPVTRHVAFTPPPLPSQPIQDDSFCSTPKSSNKSPRSMEAEE